MRKHFSSNRDRITLFYQSTRSKNFLYDLDSVCSPIETILFKLSKYASVRVFSLGDIILLCQDDLIYCQREHTREKINIKVITHVFIILCSSRLVFLKAYFLVFFNGIYSATFTYADFLCGLKGAVSKTIQTSRFDEITLLFNGKIFASLPVSHTNIHSFFYFFPKRCEGKKKQ